MADIHLASGGILRPLEPSDAEEFAIHMDRAREHIRPWVGPSFVTTDVEGARATLERYGAHAEPRIFGIRADGMLLGGVMFVELSPEASRCEIGCWLEPAGEGRGHITAAVRNLLSYAFDERGLHRAEWRCRGDNERSIAVARRLGMSFEGRLRESWLVDGVFRDEDVWAILDREWIASDGRARR